MKILLVDDEEDIRKIARLSLVRVGGFETCQATNASEALSLAHSELPDLILMDMMMPGMDGLEALAELKRSETVSQIPVIFMTAKVQKDEVDEYLRAGALGVIEKPFDPMALPDQILRIFGTSHS